jgi:hypothetical protein
VRRLRRDGQIDAVVGQSARLGRRAAVVDARMARGRGELRLRGVGRDHALEPLGERRRQLPAAAPDVPRDAAR